MPKNPAYCVIDLTNIHILNTMFLLFLNLIGHYVHTLNKDILNFRQKQEKRTFYSNVINYFLNFST